MTQKEFSAALGAFVRRRPFKPFLIEFFSGDRLLITHPEVLELRSGLYIHPTAGYRYRVFVCTSVCQLLDPPEPSPA
jgi:hypothetical protein